MLPQELDEIANKVGVGEFDLLLIGDGSGTVWNKPCGYFCWIYEKQTGEVMRLRAGASFGTNNFAELSPYVQALWVYDNRTGHSKSFATEKKTVAIISDSEITIKCGRREYGRKANGHLWAAIDWFEANGFNLSWFHVNRNTNPASAAADKFAGETRRSFLV